MVIEIWHSKDENEKPDWNDCETKSINIDEFADFTLENLSPAEYYYIRFKYLENSNYVYTYDKETKETQVEYKFETLATIGMNNVKVEYSAENYKNKFINISYNLDNQRSNMYEKTKYTFYKQDGKTQIQLSDKNIYKTKEGADYQIVDGALIVANTSYPNGSIFESVNEKIAISPENNSFDMNASYVLKITPIVTTKQTEQCEIENVSCNFELASLKTPQIGLKMERKQLTTNLNYIKTLVSIGDKDSVIYGSDWGEYTLHIYKYKDDIEKAVEVNIYDKIQDGNNITGNTFNLKDHGTNFSVYIHDEDIDYSYNYVAKLETKQDKFNNGKNMEDHTEQYILDAIKNDADVAIGSATLVKNGQYCEIRVYDSYYNIGKIDKIEYSVFNLSNNYSTTGSFKPNWSAENDGTNVIYHKTRLPVEFEDPATYTIKMNFYSGDTLVGQIDTSFIYE